jgi:hypothetical protein
MFKQHLINHVAFVIDESSSMREHKSAVISVFDSQVKYLAQLSQEMGQEVRVSVYLFSDASRVRNVIFDIDVLRLPSLHGRYEPSGWTALLDAVILSQEDLGKTFTKYGDHAFLTFVITDGLENRSAISAPRTLASILAGQDDRWTLGILVPDKNGKQVAQRYGFPEGNIAIWEIDSATGFAKAGEQVTDAVSTYMTQRATGTRGSSTLFVGGAKINDQAVAAANLTALDPSKFMLIPVAVGSSSPVEIKMAKKGRSKANPDGIPCVEIDEFVRATGRPYALGQGYYQLTLSEKITSAKGIIVVHKKTAKVYAGADARKLLGITDATTRIRPNTSEASDYDIYVQSTSLNRLLPLGTMLLLLNS